MLASVVPSCLVSPPASVYGNSYAHAKLLCTQQRPGRRRERPRRILETPWLGQLQALSWAQIRRRSGSKAGCRAVRARGSRSTGAADQPGGASRSAGADRSPRGRATRYPSSWVRSSLRSVPCSSSGSCPRADRVLRLDRFVRARCRLRLLLLLLRLPLRKLLFPVPRLHILPLRISVSFGLVPWR
jgi:hypothetical protein